MTDENDKKSRAIELNQKASQHLDEDEQEDALAAFGDCYRLLEEIGDTRSQAMIQSNMGLV